MGVFRQLNNTHLTKSNLNLAVETWKLTPNPKMNYKIIVTIVLCMLPAALAVRCYQCASFQDPKGEDNCGAYKKFDRDSHVAVECNSDESHTPGSFCMKLTQQGPKGFIWDGRWRQVVRRCASVADTGVTGVCNWGVYANGVYWEECYCSSDDCNHSSYIQSSIFLISGSILMTLYVTLL